MYRVKLVVGRQIEEVQLSAAADAAVPHQDFLDGLRFLRGVMKLLFGAGNLIRLKPAA